MTVDIKQTDSKQQTTISRQETAVSRQQATTVTTNNGNRTNEQANPTTNTTAVPYWGGDSFKKYLYKLEGQIQRSRLNSVCVQI